MNTNGSRTPNRCHFFWLALGLLLLTIYGSLIPLRYQWLPFDDALQQFLEIKWHDARQTQPRADWIVNTMQYATLSFCCMAALGLDRRRLHGVLAAALVIPS